MEVSGTRLCCIFGTIFLTTSLFAQTTVVKRTTAKRANSKSYSYVPYGSSSSYSDGYQRKKAPTTIDFSADKESVENKQEEGGYAIRRVAVAPAAEKRVVAQKRDSVSIQLFSQVIDENTSSIIEQKEVRAVVNKTLPLSCFQQNGSLK